MPPPYDNPLSSIVESLATRFNVPAEVLHNVLSTPVGDMQARDKYMPPSSGREVVGPTTDFPRYPINTPRTTGFGDPMLGYVDYLRDMDPFTLYPTEGDWDLIKKDPSYQSYVDWARQGIEPPYPSVFENKNYLRDLGKYAAGNRRRVLAAQDVGVPAIRSWFGPLNPETQWPLQYQDVVRGYDESRVDPTEFQVKSYDVDDPNIDPRMKPDIGGTVKGAGDMDAFQGYLNKGADNLQDFLRGLEVPPGGAQQTPNAVTRGLGLRGLGPKMSPTNVNAMPKKFFENIFQGTSLPADPNAWPETQQSQSQNQALAELAQRLRMNMGLADEVTPHVDAPDLSSLADPPRTRATIREALDHLFKSGSKESADIGEIAAEGYRNPIMKSAPIPESYRPTGFGMWESTPPSEETAQIMAGLKNRLRMNMGISEEVTPYEEPQGQTFPENPPEIRRQLRERFQKSATPIDAAEEYAAGFMKTDNPTIMDEPGLSLRSPIIKGGTATGVPLMPFPPPVPPPPTFYDIPNGGVDTGIEYGRPGRVEEPEAEPVRRLLPTDPLDPLSENKPWSPHQDKYLPGRNPDLRGPFEDLINRVEGRPSTRALLRSVGDQVGLAELPLGQMGKVVSKAIKESPKTAYGLGAGLPGAASFMNALDEGKSYKQAGGEALAPAGAGAVITALLAKNPGLMKLLMPVQGASAGSEVEKALMGNYNDNQPSSHIGSILGALSTLTPQGRAGALGWGLGSLAEPFVRGNAGSTAGQGHGVLAGMENALLSPEEHPANMTPANQPHANREVITSSIASLLRKAEETGDWNAVEDQVRALSQGGFDEPALHSILTQAFERSRGGQPRDERETGGVWRKGLREEQRAANEVIQHGYR